MGYSKAAVRGRVLSALYILIVGLVPAVASEDGRYIQIEEIQPGMKAYCLSVVEGVQIRQFDFEVKSVIRNFRPGLDGIVVISTDPMFQHTGPIQGCSGSPVFIDGRLAGALARGWEFSKDPLYIVTPIRQVLEVGQGGTSQACNTCDRSGSGAVFNYKEPLNLARAQEEYESWLQQQNLLGRSATLPLYASVPQATCDQLAPHFRAQGLMPTSVAGSTFLQQQEQLPPMEPGSTVTVPLCEGDISFYVLGTVTEVVGEKLYAFGHQFNAEGPTDLPMAPGYMHSVVSNTVASFKLGSPGRIVGAFRSDQMAGVYGELGATPRMIPLKISVDHYAATEKKTYECSMAHHRRFTPLIVRAALLASGTVPAKLPPEHTVYYSVKLKVAGYDPIVTENMSAANGLGDVVSETALVASLLMNNPFGDVTIESVEIEVRIVPDSRMVMISAVQMPTQKVKAGETFRFTILLDTYRGKKRSLDLAFEIPADLKPGEYELNLMGDGSYSGFRRSMQRHKYTAWDIPTLVQALQHVLQIPREKLYLTMELPAAGVAIQDKELPDLSPTKTVLLTDPKKVMMTVPFGHWLERRVSIGDVVMNDYTIKLEVEKPNAN